MQLKRLYCSECGQAVTTPVLHGRSRRACSACGVVFFQNPLPVAAAVVLNARREVLLVKRRRPPHQGLWCLPRGFAEIGETIAEAAGRELREEAGIQAEVVRLLDADSLPTDHYGDLLIITFEMQKTGGQEQPGDDAEEAGYFPLDGLPPIAFSSNEKALQICAAGHAQDWKT